MEANDNVREMEERLAVTYADLAQEQIQLLNGDHSTQEVGARSLVAIADALVSIAHSLMRLGDGK